MTSAIADKTPPRAKTVLATLILVAGVANINLAVANVALPDIGKDFDASSVALNLVAVGYSLGLAASVLYFGALGDRHGRKRMLIIGMGLSIPASLIAGFAPSVEVLFAGRLLGGIAAGLAYPTTLAIITALWQGPSRTKAIASWSALGGAISALGPVLSGGLLEVFSWHSVFLVTLPLAVIALVGALKLVPKDGGDARESVDNLGGVLSIFFVGAMVLSLNFLPMAGAGLIAGILAAIAIAAGIGFFLRQHRAPTPLFDLTIAARPTFWVAAFGGVVVFGTLMGAMYIGQQYLQNVLEYSTLAAGASVLPAAASMVLVAPLSARMVENHGSRLTLLAGFAFIALGMVVAMTMWNEHAHYWQVALVYICIGLGVGIAGTPASRSLTGSVPLSRAGMASSMSDLQRDLGGAIMQSILGAILTAGYAHNLSKQIAGSPDADTVTNQTQAALTKSFASADDLAARYPDHATEILSAARQAFVDGDFFAYAAAIIVVVAGALVVSIFYPNVKKERQLMKEYASVDN
ncbi:MFS transporter [Williamsia sp.]|uniref:MFS transporter n=1 Tax=Williamsia sp. TaxID=1872085 RepID=UPI002F95892F